MTDVVIPRGRTGHLSRARTSYVTGTRDGLRGEVLRSRSSHSSPSRGEPGTWRRRAGGTGTESREVREMRHAETVVRVIQVKHLDVCHWRAV